MDVITFPRVFFTVLPLAVGYLVWVLQERRTARRLDLQRKAAAALQVIADTEKEQRQRLEGERLTLMGRVTALESGNTEMAQKVALMSQSIVPMYEAMKLKMIEILTHPSDEFKIPDDLLEAVKKPKAELTPELTAILIGRETDTHPDVTDEERLAAKALPIIMKLADIESHSVDPVVAVQMVSTTVKTHATKEAEERARKVA